MAKQTEALKEVYDRAIKRANDAYTFERDNVRDGREDQRFYFGEQWDEAAKKARGADRPMLTVNRLGTFVRQVTGDIRQSPPAVKVLPSGGQASQEKAEIYSGMIRSIEAKSDASACYEKAASNAAQAGQGAFRVLTRYCNDRNFDQELYIEPIADPFAVLIDPFARAPDKSDMEFGYVLERMSKDGFKAKYKDAISPDDFPVQPDEKGTTFRWLVGESVRVAEYWEKQTEKTTLYELEDGTTTDKLPKGVKAKRERQVEVATIVSYVMSGAEILSGPHAWAGKYIPICFIPGEETTIDGATKRKGMVRDAKDPQRLLNYARTTEAETTALQPKAPFTVTVDQIKGYEAIWKSAGTKNHPYLPYNYNANAGPNQAPQRSQPPQMSSGLQSLSATAGQDLHDVIGIYPASLGERSNETSGVAIRARQHEGDTGSNYIPDNTKRAIAYCGRILCDMIPHIYDTQRIVRLLEESGDHAMAKINADPGEQSQGNLTVVEDLKGEYDVVVSTGPSYLTRQQEMADTMVELSRNLPIIGQAAPDLLVKALNFPGGDEIAERITPPQFKKDKQGNPLPPPPPTPDDEKAVAEAEKAKAEAEGKQLENLTAALGLLQNLQGIPQIIQAMQQQLAQLSGAGQGPPPGGPPMGPPDGGGGLAPMGGAPDGGMAELEPINVGGESPVA